VWQYPLADSNKTPASAVILAGGAGTRLWPLSRSATPKHLIKLVGDKSLLRATYERARLVADRVMVVTEVSHADGARRELPELSEDDWIVEPGRRGTAACLALAAAAQSPDGVMVSFHADHLIPDTGGFVRDVTTAIRCADETGSLVTLGIRPRAPLTGLGYIKLGEAVAGIDTAFRVERFVEKPPLAEAESMVASGDYLWNSGIFAWRNRTFLEQLHLTEPRIGDGATAAARARAAGKTDEYQRMYLSLPEMAVDHAVMERTKELLVVAADFAWSDVGSWADVAEVIPGDDQGNVISGDALVLDGSGNVVRGDKRLLALIGVSDLVVVDTPDALLICPRERVQDVKQLVAELKRLGREDLL
jgi:mannose-1-phosphate guanylyltransferase